MMARCSSTPVGGESTGDRERLAVVGEDLVGVTAAAGGFGHDLDAVRPVRPVRMAVEGVAAGILEPDEVGEPGRQGGLDLTMVLAQLGLDEREPEEGVGIVFRGERPQLGVVAAERLAALTDAEKPFSDRLQPMSRARSRRRTLCSPSIR